MLENLLSMGFSEQISREALIRTRNDLEMSLNYILENRDGEENETQSSAINTGHLRSGSNIGSVGEENERQSHIRQITDMGFSENQV